MISLSLKWRRVAVSLTPVIEGHDVRTEPRAFLLVQLEPLAGRVAGSPGIDDFVARSLQRRVAVEPVLEQLRIDRDWGRFSENVVESPRHKTRKTPSGFLRR